MDDPGRLRLLSWNLQGSHRPDLAGVAEVIGAYAPDLVALQEVQRRQAAELAERLGVPHAFWAFKHWPVVTRAEGMAVLSRLPLAARRVTLTRAPIWSWRRRIAIVATVTVAGRRTVVVNVHLSPHQLRVIRMREVARVVVALDRARPAGGPAVLVGDFNEVPAGAVWERLTGGGYRDAWLEANPDPRGGAGATNWRDDLPREGPPQQRIDFVLAGAGVSVVAATTVDPAALGFERFPALSDHLPLHAVLDITPPAP